MGRAPASSWLIAEKGDIDVSLLSDRGHFSSRYFNDVGREFSMRATASSWLRRVGDDSQGEERWLAPFDEDEGNEDWV